ncbi:ELMO/CED-12 family [Lotmaria passim]
MRRRHAPSQGSEGAASTGHVDRATPQKDNSAPPPIQYNGTPSHRATPSVQATSLLVRAPRLEEMNSSYYYIPQYMWLQMMDRAPNAVSHYFIPSIPPHHEFMLTRIRDAHVRPYYPAKADDVELLGRLWNGHNRVVFAPESLRFSPEIHAVNGRWKELGFQGVDPSTDFRGAGLFGLTQLVYLVEKHPEQWNAMLSPDFMTAAAGINVSMRLMTLLGVNATMNQFSTTMHSTYSACEGRVQLCRFIFDQNLEVAMRRLNEVYCFAMRLLHFRWMRSSRNLMEFNQQLSAMYVELERLLFVCKSLEELCSIL